MVILFIAEKVVKYMFSFPSDASELLTKEEWNVMVHQYSSQ